MLLEERERLVGEIARLKSFSPESLPKIIGVPLKAMLYILVSGPKAFMDKVRGRTGA
jgi:hypothetical protein